MMTTAELTNHVHMVTRDTMPRVTDVKPRENTVEYTIGFHRFVAMRDVTVLEVADGKVFDSEDAKYQQWRLRGGKRDDAGTLIVEESNGGEEVIDVWEVHPHMSSDFDCAIFDCHVRAAEYVKELAEMMIDGSGVNDEFTIEIQHRSMTRHDYEESCE